MIEFLKNHQLDIMLVMSGVCGVLAFFVMLMDTMSVKRKRALFYLELAGCFVLFFDRMAYLYRGNTTSLGYYMVRISNFLVFFLTLSILHSFTLYLVTLCTDEAGMEKPPKRLTVAELLVTIGWLMVILSQFTGLYYSFDENNVYQRGPLFFMCYLIPLLVLFLQLSVIIQMFNKLNRQIAVSLLIFTIAPLVASVVQLFTYGVSLTNIAMVAATIVMYMIALISTNDYMRRARKIEIEHLKGEQENMAKLFEETASAIASAIDAKDIYMRGHSLRVAGYAREIARRSGKDEKTVNEVYYAGLLHDVGKIEIPDAIITKDSGLTDKENEIIKTHSTIGRDILSLIKEFPYLSIVAAYHHERYDGRGYPEGLKGDNIPEMARIVAVADTYDAMTSRRSYRDAMPQETVREEIVKGSGTQFDPEFARIMVNMIDEDTHYDMREKDDLPENIGQDDLETVGSMHFGEYKERISDGIPVSSNIVRISFDNHPDSGANEKISVPSLILFDSNDGCVHKTGRQVRNLRYLEYAELWPDGHAVYTAARDIKSEQISDGNVEEREEGSPRRYEIEAVRVKDHVRIFFSDGVQKHDFIVALPDSVRFSYIAITGEHCKIDHVIIDETEETVPDDYIPRIAEEVTYINRVEGDIKNLQINGYRLETTQGIPVRDGMRLTFHAMSLPTSNLVWHCPYILLFSASGRKVRGSGYREYACIRLDGEDATFEGVADNRLTVKTDDDFGGWDSWKEYNKKGYDTEIRIRRHRNRITFFTDNFGISIKCVTYVTDASSDICVAITGDQVALTDIRVT